MKAQNIYIGYCCYQKVITPSIGKVCEIITEIDETVADSSDVDAVSSQEHVQLDFSSLQEISCLVEHKIGQCPFNLIQTMHHTIQTKPTPVLPNLK